MKPSWPKVKLGQVLRTRNEAPSAEDVALGKVRLVAKIRFNDGQIKFRESRETNTGLILIRPGDLLISGINAAKGAIAVYAKNNTQPTAATIHYSAYEVIKERCDITYLHWFLRSPTFQAILAEALPGGIKTELKAKRLLPIEIPLPPLSEQKRLTERVEKFTSQIDEAENHCRRAAQESDLLFESAVTRLLNESRHLEDWNIDAIPYFADINRGLQNIALAPDDKVSFVPMRAVDGESGMIANAELRLFSEAKKGYTPFQNGDVIFAKITPCMQNGKSAVANNLRNGVGFGSTEFHVLSPKPGVMPEWLHFLVRRAEFREEAAKHFTGTAGQLRVPKSFLERAEIPVPPLQEQRRILARFGNLRRNLSEVKARKLDIVGDLNALKAAVLDRAFKGGL